MSWHCAPLKSEGTFSLSGNPMRGKPQSVSNQKGSSLCLQSDDCWSQSPICWPLATVSSLLTSTNNRWLAYRTVIIARWYVYLSVMQYHNTFSISQSQPLILSINTNFQFLNHKARYFQSTSLSIPCQVLIISPPQFYHFFVDMTYQHHYHSTIPIHLTIPRKPPPPDRIIVYTIYQILLYENNRIWKAPDSLFHKKNSF